MAQRSLGIADYCASTEQPKPTCTGHFSERAPRSCNGERWHRSSTRQFNDTVLSSKFCTASSLSGILVMLMLRHIQVQSEILSHSKK